VARPGENPVREAPTRPLRVAVLGARRVRQGTGEFVARELAARGCVIAGIVGTTPASVEATRADLAARHGIECPGFTSLEALLAATPVDAVAICTPHAAHRAALERAVEARLHVFCEKPLWWSAGLERVEVGVLGRAMEDAVGTLVDRCAEAGRALHLNAQWPYTLDAFCELHPEARGARPSRVAMWLSPMTRGVDGVVDAGSHLISLLQAVLGPGELVDPRATLVDPAGDRLTVAATYVHATGASRAELALGRCAAPPRPAGYRLDDRGVERRIALPDYTISFEATGDGEGGRTVPVRDPLAASVEDFLRAVGPGPAAARRPDRTALVRHMTQLHALAAAAAGAAEGPGGAQ
jgi:predicted dehydrogenase